MYDLLLTKTHVGPVFHGETEKTFPCFLGKFGKNEDWTVVDGISYRSGEKIHRNPLAHLIEDLDEVPFPAYHLVELKNYYKSIYDVIDGFLPDASEQLDRGYFLNRSEMMV